MKISKLIKDLEGQLDEHGDLEVYVLADHGQSHEDAQGASITFLESEEYGAEETSEGEEGAVKVVTVYS